MFRLHKVFIKQQRHVYDINIDHLAIHTTLTTKQFEIVFSDIK